MALITAKQYLESLKDNRVVFLLGERIKDVTDNPILKICMDWIAMDYIMENDPEYQNLLTERNEKGEPVHVYWMAKRNAQDLLRLREIIKLMARTCFGKPAGGRFTGKDGLNSLTVVTPRVDKQTGTKYAERLEEFRKHIQETDLAIATAMTDVKGDRSMRPSKQQPHQDYYVRIVDERKDGIIVRGAKAHISGAPLCNELLVLPCRAMREEDKAYAVAFATPVDAKGLTLICTEPETKEPGNFLDYPYSSSIYINDALVVFDDVFVPKERVFLKGEWQFAGQVAHMFANFHRLGAETYKAIETELMAGIAALMAEYNGIEKAPHIQDKLAWLTMYAETVEIIGRSACEHCISEPDSDLVYPNPMYANIAKLFYADNWHQATKYVQDIAGGLSVTAPSFKDYLNPETHAMMDKYLGGKAGIPTEHRLRLLKLIKDYLSSYEDVATIHAEGSLAAQRLSIYAIADFGRYKAAAKRAAGIEDGTKHPLFSRLPQYPPKTYG